MASASFTLYACNQTKPNSHDLLLHCASLHSGLPTGTFVRQQEDRGKPRLIGGPELHFSVSHSGTWWVCAFGPQEVGLDIQQNRPCRAEALAKRFFHPEEVKWLKSRDFSQEAFYQMWTAKESYVKLNGRGFGQGFSAFSLAPPTPCQPQFCYLTLEEGYTLCLCADRIDQVTIKHFTINDGGTQL